MVFVGYLIQIFSNSFLNISLFFTNSALLLVGILILTMGASLYFTSNLGVAPYDAVGLILSKRLNIKFQYCRIFTDAVLVILSFIFHGPLGIATIFIALFTGPLISFWNKCFEKAIMKLAQSRD